MPVPKLYIDSSVIGGYFDDEWRDATQELWRQMEAGRYRFVTSTVTADELRAAPERVRDLFADAFPAEAFLRRHRRIRAPGGRLYGAPYCHAQIFR